MSKLITKSSRVRVRGHLGRVIEMAGSMALVQFATTRMWVDVAELQRR